MDKQECDKLLRAELIANGYPVKPRNLYEIDRDLYWLSEELRKAIKYAKVLGYTRDYKRLLKARERLIGARKKLINNDGWLPEYWDEGQEVRYERFVGGR